jgi:hypothetical protein
MKFLKKVFTWANDHANIYWLVFVILIAVQYPLLADRFSEHTRLVEKSQTLKAQLEHVNRQFADEVYVELKSVCDDSAVIDYFASAMSRFVETKLLLTSWEEPQVELGNHLDVSKHIIWDWQAIHSELVNAVEFYRMKSTEGGRELAQKLEQEFQKPGYWDFDNMFLEARYNLGIKRPRNPLFTWYQRYPERTEIRIASFMASELAPDNPFLENVILALFYACFLLLIVWGILEHKFLFPDPLGYLYFSVGVPALFALYFWQY